MIGPLAVEARALMTRRGDRVEAHVHAWLGSSAEPEGALRARTWAW
jgi:hypothetical protein